jgi:hypothetical protein
MSTRKDTGFLPSAATVGMNGARHRSIAADLRNMPFTVEETYVA